MITKIDHIGIAVKDLETAIRTYESFLGLHCERIEEIPGEHVKAAFIRVGDISIELLQPTDETSTVSSFLQKRGEGIHHIGFETTDVLAQLTTAKNAGCQLIHDAPLKGAGGKQIAFLHPKSTLGTLIEFCSRKPAS